MQWDSGDLIDLGAEKVISLSLSLSGDFRSSPSVVSRSRSYPAKDMLAGTARTRRGRVEASVGSFLPSRICRCASGIDFRTRPLILPRYACRASRNVKGITGIRKRSRGRRKGRTRRSVHLFTRWPVARQNDDFTPGEQRVSVSNSRV